MDKGKEDIQLLMALEVPEEERYQSIDLDVGYIDSIRSWELIVKYSGSLDRIREELNAQITELLNQYAIIIIRENLIDKLSDYPEIEYIEKPKSLFYELTQSTRASCVSPVQGPPLNVTGRGVLVAIIDSGIDYAHPDFRNDDGTTRIMYLWDQTGMLPDGGVNILGDENLSLQGGVLYTSDDINRALETNNRLMQLDIVKEIDLLGHGTHVAGIACGNGRASNGRIKGVAPESTLLVVKLANSLNHSFPRTTQLMTAVDFAIRTAILVRMPLVINISIGNTTGAHDGNSILEQYLNDVSGIWKTNIVVGTGNEGAEQGHAGGVITDEPKIIELNIGEGEPSLYVQMWKNYFDDFSIELISPSGQRTGPIRMIQERQQFLLTMTEVIILYGEPRPIDMKQEVFFLFRPTNTFLEPGNWRFLLTPNRIITGGYNFWLPSSGVLGPDTRFLTASVDMTLTIPSTARDVISVGAYDSNTDSYAYFSGRGHVSDSVNPYVKPELVAPGVNIESASPGGSYTRRSGTSMSTPFVTGAVALLMEWGIVRENDEYLYGQKLKAYLIRGARRLPGFAFFPNSQVG